MKGYEPLFARLHRRDTAVFTLQYHRVNKIALFSHCFPDKENQQPTKVRKLLIFSVDQPGLEPGTSRL
ncbi:MAG: hypothetical protein HUJ98_11855 [Bacteroidaceae bacterium]|nr:hypothetical protein [Bacteroidaceae bacterium]